MASRYPNGLLTALTLSDQEPLKHCLQLQAAPEIVEKSRDDIELIANHSPRGGAFRLARDESGVIARQPNLRLVPPATSSLPRRNPDGLKRISANALIKAKLTFHFGLWTTSKILPCIKGQNKKGNHQNRVKQFDQTREWFFRRGLHHSEHSALSGVSLKMKSPASKCGANIQAEGYRGMGEG